MNKTLWLRQIWETLVGLIFMCSGILMLLLVLWFNQVITAARVAAGLRVELPLAAQQEPDEQADDPQTPPPDERAWSDETKSLPQQGIYIIAGRSLDATMAEIEHREAARQAAIRAAAEAKRRAEEARRRAEEARRQAELERQRQIAEAKKRAAEEKKRQEEAAARAAAEKRRQEKAAEKRRQEKAAAAAKKRAVAEKRRRAEAAEAAKKAAQQRAAAKARAEAKRKARQQAAVDAKLKALGIGAPALDGLQSAAGGGYGQADIDGYSQLLTAAVRRSYQLPANISGNLEAEFLIRIDQRGRVTDVILRRSSGYPLFDIAARNAIESASPLPLPDNAALRRDTIADGIIFNFSP